MEVDFTEVVITVDGVKQLWVKLVESGASGGPPIFSGFSKINYTVEKGLVSKKMGN